MQVSSESDFTIGLGESQIRLNCYVNEVVSLLLFGRKVSLLVHNVKRCISSSLKNINGFLLTMFSPCCPCEITTGVEP